jgi:hypothetical protein
MEHTQERLVGTSTTSNDTNHSTRTALDNFLCTRWKLDSGLALVWVVSNHRHIVAGSTSKSTTVTRLLLDVRDNSSLGNGSKREDISNCEICVLASVDELTSVHSLVRNEGLSVKLESVAVSELDLRKRSTSAWVVDDGLDHTLNPLAIFPHVSRRLQLTLGRSHVAQRNREFGIVPVPCSNEYWQ